MDKGQYTIDKATPVGLWPVWAVLALSFGSGIAVFVGVGLLAWALQLSVKVALGCAGAVVLVVWVVWLGRVEGLFFARETVRPSALPVYHQDAPVVQVEVSEPEQGRWRFLDLPGGPEELEQLARGLMLGRSLAEAEWVGAGRPYTRSQFRELRGQLLERGLLVWRNPSAPSQGVELNAAGRAVFGRIAENARGPTRVRGGGRFALPDHTE